uniref:HAT C-terminal dimerisation domain-containing protein n=1 Tax=Ditylenchus dipsaci TaxID=166011 RepID=A0A915EQX4_9BILA
MFWRYCNIPEGDIMSKKDLYKFKCSIRCCCNSMLVNNFLRHPLGLNNSYLGVTLHYCDQSAVLRRGFLGLSKRMSSHSRDLIRRETEIIVDTYRVLLRKVFKVVADGGSNMVKGFRDIISIDYPVRFSSTYWLFCTRSSASDNVDVQEEFCYSFWLSNFLCSHQSIQTPDNSQGVFNALKYWSSFMDTDAEATGILALEVLTIPATIAPIERIFSQVGLATTAHRKKHPLIY